jgi:general secretion pathway protein G
VKRLAWILGIVVVVAGVIVVAKLIQRGEQEKRQLAIEELETIEFALDRYAKDNGDYPATDQGLRALWQYPLGQPAPANWAGPYLVDPILTDPWDNAYIYTRPGRHDRYTYDLFSYGADGLQGGRGEDEDVVSWLRLEEL